MFEEAKTLDGISRRIFAAQMARICLGVGVSPLLGLGGSALAAPTASGKAKRAIYLFMAGGMTHLDTFDPKPGSEIQGPTKPINTKISGVKLSEHLPKLAQRMKMFSLIRSMTTTQGAHAPGRYLARTSYSPRATIRHATMGAWVANLKGQVNKNIPANVVIGGGSDHPGAGYMDLKYAPLPIGNPESGLKNSTLLKGVDRREFDRRLNLVAKFGNRFLRRYPHKTVQGYGDMYAESLRLMASDDIKSFDVKQEDSKTRDTYGRNKFGQGCLLARRLIERDVRFVEVEFGGWDMHNDTFGEIGEKGAQLDAALSALLDDLNSRGMLDETLVVLTSEFGRSPKINDRNGRDHHPAAYSSLLAGGGIRGGYVHGASDDRGHYVEEDEVTVNDFNATIATALGIPLDHEVFSASGRPFKIADDGEAVREVLA